MMIFGLFPLLLIVFSLDLLESSIHRKRFAEDEMNTDDHFIRAHQETLNRIVFQIAKQRGGSVTLSEVVIVTGLDVAAAEDYMNSIIDGIHVTVEVDDTGRFTYEFPEFKR